MKILLHNIVPVFFLLLTGLSSVEAQGTRVDFSTIQKSGTILIYSHMDDDLIWMLPFWSKSEKFISGGMPATPSYRTIASQQQTFMNNNGYNIEYLSNWFTPWDDISETEYSEYYLEANTSYSYLVNDHLEARLYNNPAELSRYEINKIKAKIEQFFADPSMRRVITHNNWGEYGHRHHMGINKAVRELAVKYRRDVWMLGCNNGDFIDVTVPNGITWAYGSFNTPDLYTGIRTIYENNGRWTWYADRVPSGDHKFIKIVDGGSDKSGILRGEVITYPGPAQRESGAYIFDGDDDYMTLKGNNNSLFTIAMRIRPEQIREMDISAMAEYPLSSKNDRNLYLTSDGHIAARIYDGSSRSVTSSSVISAGTWTHVALSGNGSNLKLYINGRLERTISTGSAITNYSTPEFVLGQATRTDEYFIGQINNVRFFNRALSDSEISQLSGMGYTINSSAGSGGSITPEGSISVRAGSEVSFSIKANTGYEIADVKVDNSSVGKVSSYTLSNISENHRIEATFLRITYAIDVVAGSGGSINPGKKVNVNYGGEQTFSIKSDEGFSIVDVKADNISAGRVSEYTFSDIKADHSISATFAPLLYNISSVSGAGGLISPSGITSVRYGNDQSYSIIPEKGFLIKDVLVDNVSVGNVSKYTFKGVNSNHSISSVFLPISYTISSIAGPGGSINPSGQVKVNNGRDQHFNILPDDGYRISSVMVDYLPVKISSNDLTLSNVTRDYILSVAFTKIRNFTITAGAGRNGSIEPSGDLIVSEGSEQHYSITPSPGYRISSVFIDTVPIGPVSEFIFKSVTGDHTISATFTELVKTDVFPNPFRDEFSVVIRSPYDYLYKISLVTNTYRIVFVENDVPANTTIRFKPEIPPGLYILNVFQKGKKISSSRVIKY